MTRTLAAATTLLTVVLFVPGLEAEDAAERPSAAELEFFEKRVRPVLAENCWKCHGPEKQKGGLRLDSRAAVLKGGDSGPAVVPGKPDEGELVGAVRYDDPFGFQMPPSKKLPDEKIADLVKWVEKGAPWPGADVERAAAEGDGIDLAARAEHWSFQPVQRPAVPEVQRTGWARNAVDRFLLARLESADLQPAAEADRRTLLRRVSYDLTGLPPTPREIERFLNDGSPRAYEKAVDRLLASPRYGERWARHWLDLVRFAETAGHEFDYPIHHAWPYRDYVIRAFNADVPYDQFVREHVAGDLLAEPRRDPAEGSNESVIGTAFWWFGQGKHSPVDIRAEECDRIDNQLDVFGKAFLGLTVACARCHDHKFDPITTRDYYALGGFLQSSRQHYAIVNPPSETVEPARRIRNALRESRTALARYTRDRFGSLLDELDAVDDPQAEPRKELAELLSAAEKDAEHPLHGLARLTSTGDLEERDRRRKAIAGRLVRESEAAWKAEQDPNKAWTDFATFDDGTYDGWFVTGQAWSDRPTAPGDVLLQDDERQPVKELLQPGLAHSGVLSPKLEGELRSETFTIEKPVIWYRVARFGGRDRPGRSNKTGQIHLIVDGFQFIKNPLYGMLSINVKNDGRFRWIRQDVRKFQGKNAYVELLDEDDGYLVVDRIVFSNGDHPPDEPNAHLRSILDTELATKDPAGRFRRAIASVLDLWAAGKLTDRVKHAGGIELVNALLAAGLADDEPLEDEAAAGDVMEALAAVTEARERIRPAERALAIADGTGENEHLLVRGNHTRPAETVPRRFLEVFVDKDVRPPESGSGRLRLARRMTSPRNPLLARVIVNRLWQHHFGRGLVATPDNFGVLGQPPSHPELLDWLAAELVEGDWSLKAMHRLMVTSAAYRMSSDVGDAVAEERDPENVLLHRAHVQRLEGEAIRDAVLAVSGRLNQRMYGQSVLPHLTPFMEGRGRPRTSGPLDGDGRRSIYIDVRRNFLPPFFLAFDFPTPFTTTGRRSTSNVPAQALTMMNNPLVVQQSRVWAERLIREESDPEARVTRAYETAFARRPTQAELEAAFAFLDAQAAEYGRADDPRTWADLCHVLLNVKEFVFVR